MTQNLRKRRQTITLEICQNIRRNLDFGKSLKEIAALLDVSYSVVLVIANKISNGCDDSEIAKQRQGIPSIKTQIIKDGLSAIVQRDNALTQRGMCEQLQLCGLKRSQGTISKQLKKMDITRNRLTKIPLERNSPRIVEARLIYAREMQHFSIHQLVYLDETGFNLHTSSNYRYSMKNEMRRP